MPRHRHRSTPDRAVRARSRWTTALALLTGIGVLAIGLAAASPRLHEHVHHDASEAHHVCAITLATIGFCDTAAAPPEISDIRRLVRLTFAEPRSHAWAPPEYWLIPAHAPPLSRL